MKFVIFLDLHPTGFGISSPSHFPLSYKFRFCFKTHSITTVAALWITSFPLSCFPVSPPGYVCPFVIIHHLLITFTSICLFSVPASYQLRTCSTLKSY